MERKAEKARRCLFSCLFIHELFDARWNGVMMMCLTGEFDASTGARTKRTRKSNPIYQGLFFVLRSSHRAPFALPFPRRNSGVRACIRSAAHSNTHLLINDGGQGDDVFDVAVG